MAEKLAIELKVLESKKQMLFQRVQRLFDYIKDLHKPKVAESFSIGLHNLENTRIEFAELVERINILNLQISPEFNPSYQAVEAAENLYCHIIGAANQLKTNKTKTDTINASESKANSSTSIALPKLPKMELIEFSGDPKVWPIFYQNFKTCVHDNPDLDNTCKIHYLLSKLSGRALTLCSGVAPTAANYDVIFKILIDTYQDERLLANSYLRTILDFKPLTVESSHNLNLFLEKFDISVSALKELNLSDLADYLLVSLALSKIDINTRKLFEMSLKGNEIPTYKEFITFIKHQTKILSRTSSNPAPSNSNIHLAPAKLTAKTKPSYAYSASPNRNQNSVSFPCPACSLTNHTINKCNKFIKLTPSERYKLVKEQRLCLNCLSPKHGVVACKSINSCNTCKIRHHTLLHFGHNPQSGPVSSPDIESDSIPTTSLVSNQGGQHLSVTSILPTAEIVILVKGRWNKIRVLLDSGSQDNFLSLKCCNRLKISMERHEKEVRGIGDCSSSIIGIVRNLQCSSRLDKGYRIGFNAYVLPVVTNYLPTINISRNSLPALENLRLADPSFDISSEIDGILGATIFASSLIGKRVLCNPTNDNIFALETSFGFVLVGDLSTYNIHSDPKSFCATPDDGSLDERIRSFFNLEDVPELVDSPEIVDCENHFVLNYSRDETGRYVVALPFKTDPSHLGNSFSTAFSRFLSLERKFRSSDEFYNQYRLVIQSYIDQGHMHKVESVDPSSEHSHVGAHSYYIPHHAVFKYDCSSTPLRIVFDASAKTSSNLSLNDCLYTGEKQQTDIIKMLLNFRIFSIAMIADIAQMYRQIRISPQDYKYQRILWRFSPDHALDIYELNTVTFGIKSSPYLALRVLRELAMDQAQTYPQASQLVAEDMYVDDLVTSLNTFPQAERAYFEITDLLKSGGFEITKWHSNSNDVISLIPNEKRSPKILKFNQEYLKVLGMQWHSSLDILSFGIQLPDNNSLKSYSKRSVLSEISKLFDPLGILGPVILFAKLFIRDLWCRKLGWDSPLPTHLQRDWGDFMSQLPLLKQICIPRWIGMTKNSSLTIIGFSDACQRAYGAVVYSRVEIDDHIVVNLLCSKSKVAPLKQVVSIPRLELCAALLLSKLIKYVVSLYSNRCNIDKVIACSDSQIVLSWLADSPQRWKVFVANRVSKIQNNLPPSSWFFVPGHENIADKISRGDNPISFLKYSSAWLEGPAWLKEPRFEWPLQSVDRVILEDNIPETHNVSFIANTEQSQLIDNIIYKFIANFSNFRKLLRSMVYLLRFCRLLRRSTEITVPDLESAEIYLIKCVQEVHFPDLIYSIKNNKSMPSFRKLYPFIDNVGIIRVGGRLVNASVGYDYKHQILLPKRDHFVTILVDYFHKTHLHTGAHLLSSLLRNRYWIISSRQIIRQRIRLCNYCFKLSPKPTYPLMANLPSARVSIPLKAFPETGVDYAGPFNITLTRHRGVKTQKAYVCLFVCLATKCIHLELASDLSTDTFLDALKRFISRRGPIKTLYSDQGTNFIGAKSYLDELQRLIVESSHSDSLKNLLLENRITWRFNVPLAPHMGGLWESNVKSMKTHLFKAIGNQILCYEEFITVLTQIEALLNSRPICTSISEDPSDPCMLTPAHFLMTSIDGFPSIDVSSIPLNRLNRKQLLDNIVQTYWQRWKNEYLHQLQTRSKWNTLSNPIRIGTVVIIMNQNTPPLQWPLGIIQETFPGIDGIVRIASVKTKHGLYKRPITKLCPLPSQ